MKHIKLLVLCSTLLIASCGSTSTSSFDSQSSIDDSSTSEVTSEEISTSEIESTTTETTSEDDTSIDTSEESTSEDTSETSTSESSSEEEWVGEKLPIGNTSVPGPDNKSNPIDIASDNRYEADLSNHELPSGWSAIWGNNKTGNGNWYANGTYKFASLYHGLQTPYINSWKKIEIRFYIDSVNNCKDDGKKEDEPIFHIYGYNTKEKLVSTDYLDQGKITTSSVGNYVRVYVRNIDISYLEFRLNANPCKGSQHYNFGLSKITLYGWDYE